MAAMGLRADSACPQRISGSARTDSRRAESARNPIASHVNFSDDSALNAFTHSASPHHPVDGHLECPAATLRQAAAGTVPPPAPAALDSNGLITAKPGRGDWPRRNPLAVWST